MAKQKQQKKKIKAQPAPRSKRTPARFGPVTTISTAPVAIGNSIRGSQPQVINSANGCRVVGRDFCFEAKATVAAANGWSLIGGMPISPAVLATSSLRSYTQLFSQFRVNRLMVHYITSSPTSQAGDIMFYYERERNSPMVDFTNNSFLPLVLSDPNTVIGPQWQNHSILINPVKEWKNTNYGLNSDLNEETTGSVFLFSKTNAASSPGYVLVDFDITFKELSINPRAGSLPVSRGLWNYLTLGKNSVVVTSSTGLNLDIVGLNPDGSNSTIPQGAVAGDIYKVVFLVTNSTVSGTNATWTTVTPSTLVSYQLPSGGASPTIVDDGFTCYGVWSGSTVTLHPSLESAKANSTTSVLRYGIDNTVAFRICTMVSLVGSNGSQLQATY